MSTLVSINNMELMQIIYGTKRHHSSIGPSHDHLEISEFLLASKLKGMCRDDGVEVDFQKSAKVFHELGQVYRERSPDKIALIKCAVLFKAALVRKPDSVSKNDEDLRELCSHVLFLSGAKHMNACLVDKANSLLMNVTEMREMVKTELQSIEALAEHESEEAEGQLKKIELIEKLQCQVYDWYSKTMKDVMDYCLFVKGDAPCEYALFGMGSLAKKEITPYSDFEHGILLEEYVRFRADFEEILEYFRWVTVIFQLMIINLGETIVPIINLTYLNNPFMKQHDWFFDVHTTRGISFDGMVPYACKFPLGRSKTPNKPWKVELIKPVSQMLKYISAKEDLKNGYHLADMLMTTCFVSGNQRVYETFSYAVKKLLKSNFKTIDLRQQIEEDVKNFNPISGLDGIFKSQKWNMKRVVYRSTTLFVEALGKNHGCDTGCSFNVVRQLANIGVIEDNFAHDLLYAVAIALQVRLSTYFQKRRQDDWLRSPTAAERFDIRFVQLMGMKTPVKYFQTAMKLQRETCNRIGVQSSNFVQRSSSLDHLLACFWLRLKQETIYEADRICSAVKPAEVMHIVNEILLVIGLWYYEEQNAFQALPCYQRVHAHWSEDLSQPCEGDMAHCLYCLGRCLFELGKYEDALQQHKKELEIRKQITRNATIDLDIAACHQCLGYSYARLQNYDGAKMFFEKAKLIRETNGDPSLKSDVASGAIWIGECLYQQDMYKGALEHFEEAVEIRKVIVDDENVDTTYALYCHHMGCCLSKLRRLESAKTFFEKAKLIWETNGDPLFKSNIASDAGWIGECFFEQDMHKEALVHYEEAMEITKVLVDENIDTTYALYCYKTSTCLFKLRRFNEAKTIFQKVKLIWETKEDLTLKPYVADGAYCIGKCFYEQNIYEEALVHFEEAVKIKQMLVGHQNIDDTYGLYCHQTGLCLLKLRRYDDGKQFFEQAKLIWETNSDPSWKPNIAEEAHCIGECFFEQDMHKEALTHYEEAVKIRKGVIVDKNVDATLAVYCHSVATCFFKLRRLDDAKRFFKKSKLIWETKDDPLQKSNVAEDANWIGKCFFQLEMYKDALVHYKEAVEIRKVVIDDESSDATYALYCHHMGVCLFKLKKLDDAKNFFEKAKLIWKTKENPPLQQNLAESTHWIGDCFFEQNMFQEALTHYEEAVKIRKVIIDDENVDATYGLYCHQIGACLFNLERLGDAIRVFKKAKRIQEASGDPSLQTNIVVDVKTVGDCFFQQDMYKDALVHYEEALKIREMIVNDENVDATYALYCHQTGVCLFKLRRLDDAKIIFEKAKLIWETIGDLSLKSNIASTVNWIGDCFTEQGMYKEALVHYEEAMKIKSLLTDDENTDATYALYCHNMAACLFELRRMDDAKRFFEKSKLIRETNNDPSLKSNIADGANWIGDCFYEQDMFKEALLHYEEAMNIRKVIVDDENTDATFAYYCYNVSACLVKLRRLDDAKIFFKTAKLIAETTGDPSLKSIFSSQTM